MKARVCPRKSSLLLSVHEEFVRETKELVYPTRAERDLRKGSFVFPEANFSVLGRCRTPLCSANSKPSDAQRVRSHGGRVINIYKWPHAIVVISRQEAVAAGGEYAGGLVGGCAVHRASGDGGDGAMSGHDIKGKKGAGSGVGELRGTVRATNVEDIL